MAKNWNRVLYHQLFFEDHPCLLDLLNTNVCKIGDVYSTVTVGQDLHGRFSWLLAYAVGHIQLDSGIRIDLTYLYVHAGKLRPYSCGYTMAVDRAGAPLGAKGE